MRAGPVVLAATAAKLQAEANRLGRAGLWALAAEALERLERLTQEATR